MVASKHRGTSVIDVLAETVRTVRLARVPHNKKAPTDVGAFLGASEN
jgi:hypothetical protein